MTDDKKMDPACIERDAIAVERPAQGVAVLTIRSAPLGVLRMSVKRAIRESLTALEADQSVRAVIVTGTGRAFSVGSDIRDFEPDPGWQLAAEREENALNDQIEGARFAVISAVNGHCHGGGLVLAMACDLRVASRSACVSLPEVKVGAFASGSGTQRIVQFLGKGRTLDLLLTGRVLAAEQALAIGLVDRVFEDDQFTENALVLAKEIAALPPGAVEASKRCVNQGLRHGWAHGIRLEADYAASLGVSEDAIEGQRAFREKRPPRFTGR